MPIKPKFPHPLRDPASSLCDIMKLGYFHQLRLLVSVGIDLECRDSNRRTPIMLCALMEPETWGVGIARNLIENNVRLDKKDRYGRNVFHYACIYERVELMHVLIKAMDFDLNQADQNGNTGLHYAALSGNVVATQIVARVFKRYRIPFGKTNKRGFTALEEALRCAKYKCGHVIEQEMNERRPGSAMKDVRFADEVIEEPKHIFITKNRSYMRPWSTPCQMRRNSSLSSMSLDDNQSSSSYRISRTNLSSGGGGCSPLRPWKMLVAIGVRDENDIIHCAEAADFRNNPDFVFKLVHLHYDANEWLPCNNESTNRVPVWNDTCSTNQSQSILPASGWRQDLKSLFQVYESQCSMSWRAGQRGKVPINEEQAMVDDDEKGKKTRRQSSQNKPGTATKEQEFATQHLPPRPHHHQPHLPPELKRRLSTTRMRRRSSIHGLLGKFAAGASSSKEDSLNTSSESINSLVVSNKRRGSEKDLNPQPPRSQNSTTGTGVMERANLSPSPSLVIPAITATTTSSSSSATAAAMAAAVLLSSSTAASGNKKITSALQEHKTHPKQSSKSKGRRVSLINASRKLLDRKNDDADIKTNRSGTKSEKGQATNHDQSKSTGSPARKMALPKVKEYLVEDKNMPNDVTTRQDTTRLWVQNPYVDDEDDDDYDDFESDLGDESGMDA